MATNLFEELKDLLQEFKDFLDDKAATIKPVIQALAAIVDQVNDLLNLLIDLMGQLKTEIENLDVSTIPGIGEVTGFTDKVKALLQSARSLLPGQAGTIDEVLRAADVIGSLPSVDQVKTEILGLIDAIVAHLQSFKS
jgi:phage-related protein